jgi:C_GCAxxG_C_C family probable redox protein
MDGDRRRKAEERARRNYLAGYNCAQSVMEALGHAEGIEVEPLVRMVTGLGGGLARHGEACGALVAGVLWLSMACGTVRPDEPRADAYGVIERLLDDFRESNASMACREINGLEDFTSEEHFRRCSEICARTAGGVISILEGRGEGEGS